MKGFLNVSDGNKFSNFESTKSAQFAKTQLSSQKITLLP